MWHFNFNCAYPLESSESSNLAQNIFFIKKESELACQYYFTDIELTDKVDKYKKKKHFNRNISILNFGQKICVLIYTYATFSATFNVPTIPLKLSKV